MTLWGVAAYFLMPYVVGALVWRALRYPPYWSRWAERFGFGPALTGKRVIWVHAVSVGEVRSAAPLIEALTEQFPHHRVLVTTMTPTGADQVRDLFGDTVSHAYAPYDFPDAVSRFLDRVRPELAVIAETEFWPNLFAACRRRGIPLYLVNVRLSQASFRGYSWFPHSTRRMLAETDLICAQSSLDAQRLRNLGVPGRLIRVTGNLKFDVELPASLLAEGRALRREWGKQRPVLIAASTHAGEERMVLEAFRALRMRFPTLLLVLVPRHPERFLGVARLCRGAGYGIALRSTREDVAAQVDVLVGDTMGELHRLYAAADVAFIGGSLVRRGGQNLLEACAVSVPVIFGPHMFHFEEISALALDRGAARQVQSVAELVAAVALYFEQPALREAAGSAAHGLVTENRGALARTLKHMGEALAAGPARSRLDVAADARRP
jgi:3-deoxy-D-manno-octulosonic-acid transferase